MIYAEESQSMDENCNDTNPNIHFLFLDYFTRVILVDLTEMTGK